MDFIHFYLYYIIFYKFTYSDSNSQFLKTVLKDSFWKEKEKR
ncbi:hypothetical protein BD94_0415 [Elizabethkingia anophelis NUHP1]|uniref:Uncharacterized protein n=1 Tax=Elizabethkingia anophelis NUHP1 TaxID=1338011 RepID=A0A077EFB2_9FLAO|nr:hypothetical protein BD94_0415 [Elizabethkingia anophelis NUHP1]